MGFVVTPQVRELMQSNNYELAAVITEILRLQEQSAPEPPSPGAATGASSHASASYFEHKLDAVGDHEAAARLRKIDERIREGEREWRRLCEEPSAVGSASESMSERPASPAEAAVTGGEGRERGREGGRGTANERAVLAPALQSAPRAQPHGVPTAVMDEYTLSVKVLSPAAAQYKLEVPTMIVNFFYRDIQVS
jgi:hypothetical protein